VTTATVGLCAVALWSFGKAILGLVSALSISAESIANGFTVPAAAVDGVSTGTLAVGKLEVTQLYDGNGVPSPEAILVAHDVRDFMVPYTTALVLDAAFVLSLAIVVVLLCIRLERGRPFVAHLTWSLAIFAVVTAVFSIGSQLVRGAPFAASVEPGFRQHLATMMAAFQAPPIPGIMWDNDITYTAAAGPTPLDLTFVGMALLLGLIAAAFALGQRLQRDTDGLV
jgi:hypothetical protein